ncbi:MAG: hypothetical protein LBM93_06250 [Oscillospiraceae bacterium]|jgi:hypothetical protein|nr:hypothetical protein [Oscillospiraceae bacterium]
MENKKVQEYAPKIETALLKIVIDNCKRDLNLIQAETFLYFSKSIDTTLQRQFENFAPKTLDTHISALINKSAKSKANWLNTALLIRQET